ncbi:hypothetical protein [Ureaplasma ceti]|uniref:Lipoprotein n=1 Tax=Ureaplasma ceti TaxID=3119530 RepID=A0ABP9U6Y9_9BACT
MKKSLSNFIKIGLPILAVAGIATALPVALTSCSNPDASSSSATFNFQNNLKINGSKDTSNIFSANKHNNVNLADMAAVVNANELNYMYNTLNSSAMKPFMQWLHTKKILVVDGQIPNPKWVRVPTDAPNSDTAKIQAIQNDFVLDTPTIYSTLYSAPTNRELPGFGMQMALPSNPDNLKTLEQYWKGQIVATTPGKTSAPIFQAMEASADIVLYVYPGTSTWITPTLAEQALKPLLTTNSQKNYTKAIIPVTLAQGFDSLNSPIGMLYLFSSLINGQAYKQSADGVWTANSSENWANSLSSLYIAENASSKDPTVKAAIDAINAVKPYFTIEETFGLDMAKYGYCEEGKKAVFPFAEKYIHTLMDETKGSSNHRTLSAYFNDTSMLLALGFTPYYSTYIIDPGTAHGNARLEAGIIMPGYIQNIYPNLISKNKNNVGDGQTFPLLQSRTGIWQHHVEPNVAQLRADKVGTVLADDWLMPKTATIYNNGTPQVNHIIYNTQGDYTTNGQIFYTKNDKSAQHNTGTAITNQSVSNSGFMPKNLMNLQSFISGKSYWQWCYDNSTTGISTDRGNIADDDFQGFQWFANQLEAIQGNEFQVPKTSFMFQDKLNGITTSLDAATIAKYAAYSWNVASVQAQTVAASAQQPVTDSPKQSDSKSPVTGNKDKTKDQNPVVKKETVNKPGSETSGKGSHTDSTGTKGPKVTGDQSKGKPVNVDQGKKDPKPSQAKDAHGKTDSGVSGSAAGAANKNQSQANARA